jgi:hypothetical protein
VNKPDLRFGAAMIESCQKAVASVGRHQSYFWKINPIASSVPSEQDKALKLGVCANVEVGQGSGLRTSAAAVLEKSLRDEHSYFPGQFPSLIFGRAKIGFELLLSIKRQRHLGEDNGIDDDRSSIKRRRKLIPQNVILPNVIPK